MVNVTIMLPYIAAPWILYDPMGYKVTSFTCFFTAFPTTNAEIWAGPAIPCLESKVPGSMLLGENAAVGTSPLSN